MYDEWTACTNLFIAYLIFADMLLMTAICNLFHKCPYVF